MTAGGARTTTPAVGGTREVPVPDAVARAYLLLALRLDQHIAGFVDAYVGPADLKAQVDMEPLRAPTRLREDAADLRRLVAAEVVEPERRDWLDAQAGALATHAAVLAGEQLPYLDLVTRAFAWTPVRRDDRVFDVAAGEIDALLPGDGPLDARLAAWDERFTVDPERVREVVDWLVERFRERAARLFGLPAGERLTVSLVRGQPWSGYNWYEGGLRSRIDLNLDLPIRAADLVHVVAHETFPGHHLERAWKEAELVLGRGRLEASVTLINTPESLVSEGLADVGVGSAAPPAEMPDLLVELYGRAGLAIAADPAAAREAAHRSAALVGPRRRLSEARVNAALMRHADGASQDEVLDYLVRVGRMPRDVATKRLEFIEHPLWRTYVFVYHEGEALLRRWLDQVPEMERAARFGRLLQRQLTPRAIAAEIDEG